VVNPAARRYNAGHSLVFASDTYETVNERNDSMLKRDKLKAVLRKITDDQFNSIWKSIYGYVPTGERSELARDFVAEQYDKELDDCIKRVESCLKSAPTPKPKSRWLSPRASTATSANCMRAKHSV
jgi:hypothetical protein